LTDEWERWAGDATQLDAMLADTDGDGTPDGQEDPDGDGLTNLEEFALTRLSPEPAGLPPHPFTRSLLVELDAMDGRRIDPAVLERAAEAYAAIGIDVSFFRDEEDLEPVTFDGTFEQRWARLKSSGPLFRGHSLEGLRVDRMIHVMAAAERTDTNGRGGEVVTDGEEDPEKTGVFLYFDTLDRIHPACARFEGGPITVQDALTGTLVHELGHALQLGHDTGIGGGVNHFNIMSLASSCEEALMHLRGTGNDDESLGATAAVGEPRFSEAAARLVDLDRIVSVDTATLVGDNGRDM
jgi:hypothetical protein